MASHLELNCKFPFDTINELLIENVKDIQLNEKIMLHSVHLKNIEQKILAISTVSGAYDGDVHITFIPRYIKEQFKFVLDDLEIKIASNSIFAKGANFMANKMFGNTIDAKMEEIINAQIMELKDEWFEKLAHFEVAPNLYFSLTNPRIDFKNIKIDDDGIACLMMASGEMSLDSRALSDELQENI